MDIENSQTEWKEIWKSEYLRTVSAFHNTDGGRMVIGRDDDGKYVGVKDIKAVMKAISDSVHNKLHIVCDVHEERFEGTDCIVIDVPAGRKIVSYNGGFYIRIGNTTQELEGDELKERILHERGMQWLDQPSDVSIGDLSKDAIAYFVRKGKEFNRIPDYVDEKDVESILRRYDLIESDKVTLAGALLFSDVPRHLNRGAYLKMGLFNSKGVLTREDYIEAPLIKVPELAMDRLFDVYIPPIFMYDKGPSRYIRHDYPKDAVRELILNAIIHMDYKMAHPVTVAVHPDRVEIFCLGGLAHNVSIDSIVNGGLSVRRNDSLAFAFHASGFVEVWGQGIPKVIEACQENGNSEPEFTSIAGGLRVILRPSVQKRDVVSIQSDSKDVSERILELMRENPKIRIVDLIELIGVSERAVNYSLASLKKEGKIVRIGSDRYGQWEVKDLL